MTPIKLNDQLEAGWEPSGAGPGPPLENGARDCYYLDLSRQVAQAPVKVNRDGRTDYCISQPLAP